MFSTDGLANYDVDFTAARWDENGKKSSKAKITVKLNGIVVHRDVKLPRTTTAAPVKDGPEDGPIYLQDHGNPVRYRNIWVRPRNVDAEARRPIISAFERFHSSPTDQVAAGRLLLGELNCVSCHPAGDQFVKDVDPKRAPILDNVGDRIKPEWMVQFIADPHSVKPGTTMPDLLTGMDASQRKDAAIALANYLIGTDTIRRGGKGANSEIGEKLFHQSGCVACHMPRTGKLASASSSVPLVGLDKKYSRASLEQFLRDPLAVRPSGRMPKIELGGDNWRHVAQYLTGDTEASIGGSQNLPPEPNMTFASYNIRVDKLPKLDSLTPERTGVSRGLDIGVGKRDTDVVISWRGDLPIKNAGTYRFRLRSDDGSKLYIDDQVVVDNDGVHGEETKEGNDTFPRESTAYASIGSKRTAARL